LKNRRHFIPRLFALTFSLIIFGWGCQHINFNRVNVASRSPTHSRELLNSPLPIPPQLREIDRRTGSPNLKPIEVDFPYATTNNFLREKVYPCSRCFLRPDVANSVEKAHRKLQEMGYDGLRLLDCYRPKSIQQRMWDIVGDPNYVANPQRGSDHNRGTAVDLTIVDRRGNPLDMGTPFDEFSIKAHHTYRDLPQPILRNRLLLKNVMASVGLTHIDTEWWHYVAKGVKPNILNWVWNCPPESSPM
jgi:zinc D-Ala-D-Ala dipeptidase